VSDLVAYCPATDPGHSERQCDLAQGHDGPHLAMRWLAVWS
jgi:hypothetical protein